MNKIKNSLKQIINFRIDKLNKLIKNNIDPYPHNYTPTNNIKDIIKFQKKYLNKHVNCAGRIVSFRKMGKASFLNIMDSDGKIQIYLKSDLLP